MRRECTLEPKKKGTHTQMQEGAGKGIRTVEYCYYMVLLEVGAGAKTMLKRSFKARINGC